MEFIYAGVLGAAWLGILTSISPCPLATNIAAISYIGNKIGSTKSILISGLLYTVGRMVAYLGIAVIIMLSMLSVPDIAMFLQKYINIVLGPILIVVGLILLNIIKLNLSTGGKMMDKAKTAADKAGICGAALLGFVFALSFCPVSAALYFGSLLPLAVKYQSEYLIPTIYGIGTALPVIVFAFILSFGTQYVAKMYDKISKFEWYAQRVTGVLFILIGLCLSYEYIL